MLCSGIRHNRISFKGPEVNFFLHSSFMTDEGQLVKKSQNLYPGAGACLHITSVWVGNSHANYRGQIPQDGGQMCLSSQRELGRVVKLTYPDCC